MNKEKRINKTLIFDISLIAVLLAVALCALLIMSLKREAGAVVVVTDGEHSVEYSLSENGEYTLAGGGNVLVIEDGCAYMKYASCPDKTCVHTGKISKTGERIVCLPNKVTVVVKSEGEEIFESQ